MKIIKISKDLTVNPNTLSKEVLNRMYLILKREGYDIRGSEDLKSLMNKIRDRSNGVISEEGYKHFVDAYQEAIQSKNKRVEKLEVKKEEQAKQQNINWKRLRQLGYTNDPKEAGYIDPNGNLLDFSGKKEGGYPGDRNYDHREIGGSAGMSELIALGYIRMGFSGKYLALDIAKLPTNKQFDKLFRITSDNYCQVVINVKNGLGEYRKDLGFYSEPVSSNTLNYESPISPNHIINDIIKYFKGINKMSKNLNWYKIAKEMNSALTEQELKEAGIKENIAAVLFGLTLYFGGESEISASEKAKVSTQQIEIAKKDSSKINSAKIIDALARTIYAEAEGESYQGKQAVASVIYNRGGGSVNKMVSVVKAPKQFSCWNSGTPKAGKGQAWEDSVKIATLMVVGKFQPTVKYTHYFNPQKCKPSWAYDGKNLVKDHQVIGNHTFLNPKKK